VHDDTGEPLYHGEDIGAARLPLGRDTVVAAGAAGAAHGDSGSTSSEATSDKSPVVRAVDSLGVALPEDAQFLKVTLPEMDVPADETRYFCVYMQPPRNAKYHIYSARQVGDARIAKELVHHIGLYAASDAEVCVQHLTCFDLSCVLDLSSRSDAFTHTTTHKNKPHTQPLNPVGEVFDCTEQAGADHGLPIMIIDRGDVSTPSPHAYEAANASMPFGEGYDEYWLLEVHYNNPENKAGLRDATGVEIAYSPTLRQHDVGVLVLGAPPHVPKVCALSYAYVTTKINMCIPDICSPARPDRLASSPRSSFQGASVASII
jgi:hypothetical protein